MSVPATTPDTSLVERSAPRIDEPRLRELRAELEAREDKLGKAVISDSIGRLLMREPAQEGAAARELLAAFNHEPSFRPPLHALVDSFERKRSLKNLGRLYEAEHRSATDDGERVDALLDRAVLLFLTGGEPGQLDAFLDEAVALRPARPGASPAPASPAGGFSSPPAESARVMPSPAAAPSWPPPAPSLPASPAARPPAAALGGPAVRSAICCF